MRKGERSIAGESVSFIQLVFRYFSLYTLSTLQLLSDAIAEQSGHTHIGIVSVFLLS